MRLIQAVLFDLDGTLANTLVSIASFANEALADCCLPAIETYAYRYLVGNGRDTLIRRMLHTLGQPEDGELFDRVGTAYDAAYAAEPLRLVTAYPHIPQLLEGLKDRGIPCAVLSNKPDDMTHAVVGGLFARDTFAVVRGQRDGVPKKPAPDAVFSILNALGVEPAHCLYVGDTKVDMQTGKNAGAVTAVVLWGFRDEDELRANGADHIVGDPLELLKLVDA